MRHQVEESDIVAFAKEHKWLLLLKETEGKTVSYHWLTPSGFFATILIKTEDDGSLLLWQSYSSPIAVRGTPNEN